MARKTSRKLVYTLSSESSHNGHSLGVNSLAIDPNAPQQDSLLFASPSSSPTNSLHNKGAEPRKDAPPSGILYSAGRDGAINAWRIHDTDLSPTDYSTDRLPKSSEPGVSSSTSLLSEALKNEGNPSTRPPTQRPQPPSIRSFNNDIEHATTSVSKLIGPSIAAFLRAPPPDPFSYTIKKPALPREGGYTTFGLSGQNHTNWVNDIVLVNNQQQGTSKLSRHMGHIFLTFSQLFLVRQISQSSYGIPTMILRASLDNTAITSNVLQLPHKSLQTG